MSSTLTETDVQNNYRAACYAWHEIGLTKDDRLFDQLVSIGNDGVNFFIVSWACTNIAQPTDTDLQTLTWDQVNQAMVDDENMQKINYLKSDVLWFTLTVKMLNMLYNRAVTDDDIIALLNS